MNKSGWLHLAEVVDAWRIIPRLFLGATTTVICCLLASLVFWYERTPGAWNGYVTAALTIFTGSLATLQGFIYKCYADTGRNWADHPAEDSK